MATHLDLQEQEQLDELKAFWGRYGNLLTWLVIAALAAYAGWNGWNYWQREQAVKAGSMFDELDSAVEAGDADRSARIFADMKSRYPRTTFTQQGGLLAAKVQADKGQPDAARASLVWVADNAGEIEVQTAARLRIAALLLDQKKYDDALKQLDAATAPTFAALVDDRRGDVLQAAGKPDDAKRAYLKAWQAMDEKTPYRRMIEAKLSLLGAAPAAPAASAAAAEVAK